MTLTTFSAPSGNSPMPRTRWPLSGAEEAALEMALRGYHALSWPVQIHPGARRITVGMGRRMNALSMPKALGVAVARELSSTDQPVVALTVGQGHWTLLTGPRPGVADLPQELLDEGVRAVPRGAQLVLPVVGLRAVRVKWVHEPQADSALPSHTVILALAHRAVRNAASAQPPLLPR